MFNSFEYLRLDYPEAVEDIFEDIDEWKFYELEKVVDKRVIRRGRGRKFCIEYFIRFKGYESEYNDWYPDKLLDNARDLIKEYE